MTIYPSDSVGFIFEQLEGQAGDIDLHGSSFVQERSTELWRWKLATLGTVKQVDVLAKQSITSVKAQNV